MDTQDKRTEFIVGHFSGLMALLDMFQKSGLVTEEEASEVLTDSYEIANDLVKVFQLADAITAGVDADIRGVTQLREEKLRESVAAFRASVERISSRVCGELVIGEIRTKVEVKLAEFRKSRRKHLKVVDGGNQENAS